MESLHLAGGVGTLLELFEEFHSRQMVEMRTALDRQFEGDALALDALYEAIAPIDFSRDVLELQAPRLEMLGVPRCGWTDLGTVRRVEATVRNLSASAGVFCALMTAPAPLFFDLSAAAVSPRHRQWLSVGPYGYGIAAIIGLPLRPRLSIIRI